MAVVLVDGWPTDKVEEASRLARESGINIFFVTIEGADDVEKPNMVESDFVDRVGWRCVVINGESQLVIWKLNSFYCAK